MIWFFFFEFRYKLVVFFCLFISFGMGRNFWYEIVGWSFFLLVLLYLWLYGFYDNFGFIYDCFWSICDNIIIVWILKYV